MRREDVLGGKSLAIVPIERTDWSRYKDDVLARLDVAAEFADLGVRFSRSAPDARGRRECHSVDRPDDSPSAFVNVATGIYFDSGSGEKGLHLFQFALKVGKFGRWIDAARHYGEKAGVPLVGVKPSSKGRVLDSTFDYRRADGTTAYRVFRYITPAGGKDFSQHPPDGKGGWKYGVGCMDGVEPVPFRLPELIAADPDDPVFLCEGETAALAVVGLGLVATTAHGGTGNTDKVWSRIVHHFAGRDCYILPDNDHPGRVAAAKIANRLHGVARSVKVVTLPDLPPKGDAVEWVADGGTAEELGRLAHAAPAWEPGASSPDFSPENTSQKSQNAQKTPSPGDDDGCFESKESFETHSVDLEWKTPRLHGPAPAVPFPLGCLPGPVADHVAVVADRMGCPVDFPALAALGVASGAIGRSVVLILRNGWEEQGVFYLVLVGNPGMTKSPVIATMARPLSRLAGELLSAHKRERERWKDNQDGTDTTPAPILRRVMVDDATVESIAPILQDNPRGLVMVRDELSALFAGMGQYKSGGKGADRQFFLSAWSGSTISVDRKGNPDRIPIHVSHPFLSIVGGLTPGMLSELGESRGRDDGFLDRLLFAVPEPVPVRWTDEGIPAEMSRRWDEVVRALWDSSPDVDPEGVPRPHYVRLAPEAREMWGLWHDIHMAEAGGEDFPDHLQGTWSKLRSCCARSALVLDRLTLACNPAWDGLPSDVSAASLSAAIDLTTYFKANAERVHTMIRGTSGDNPDAHAILRWVKLTNRSRFSERDARQNFRRRFPVNGPELEDALRWLIGRHCLRPVEMPTEPRACRPHSPIYDVNPALFSAPSPAHAPDDPD